MLISRRETQLIVGASPLSLALSFLACTRCQPTNWLLTPTAHNNQSNVFYLVTLVVVAQHKGLSIVVGTRLRQSTSFNQSLDQIMLPAIRDVDVRSSNWSAAAAPSEEQAGPSLCVLTLSALCV